MTGVGWEPMASFGMVPFGGVQNAGWSKWGSATMLTSRPVFKIAWTVRQKHVNWGVLFPVLKRMTTFHAAVCNGCVAQIRYLVGYLMAVWVFSPCPNAAGHDTRLGHHRRAHLLPRPINSDVNWDWKPGHQAAACVPPI